jgi:ubiquinone/menaquinone biosynthesis C-methylase UbiE
MLSISFILDNMKEGLKAFLKRSPKVYSIAEWIYLKANDLKLFLFGTKVEERWWATRHRHEGNDWNNKQHIGEDDEWVISYWDSRNHSHRSFLAERISRLSPSSILEIGCNCGPNLYLLAQRFPNAEIVGIDINPMAVEIGNKLFAQEGLSNVKLLVGRADELKRFESTGFDVLFTDAVLIYIGPDKIKKVIAEMLKITRKALIFWEWHSFDYVSNPLGTRVGGHWMRDYVALFKQFIPEKNIRVTKMPEELWLDKNWQRWGGVIEVNVNIKPNLGS